VDQNNKVYNFTEYSTSGLANCKSTGGQIIR